MCLILVKPANIKLPKMLFKNVFERNKNGFGFMYHKNGIAKFEKTISKNWEEHFTMFEPYQDLPVALHWRMKTQGGETINNAHPFEIVENEIILMHNGSISGMWKNNKEDDRSDTSVFVDEYLKPLAKLHKDPNKTFSEDAIKGLISRAIGDSNKLVILVKDTFHFFNSFMITDESYVPEMQGLIFSNTYAWDNQYWFKTASKNEINAEYCPNTTTSYNYGQSGYDYAKNSYQRRHHRYSSKKEWEATKTPSQSREEIKEKDRTIAKTTRDKGKAAYGKTTEIVEEIEFTTLHLVSSTPKEKETPIIVTKWNKETNQEEPVTTTPPVITDNKKVIVIGIPTIQ